MVTIIGVVQSEEQLDLNNIGGFKIKQIYKYLQQTSFFLLRAAIYKN